MVERRFLSILFVVLMVVFGFGVYYFQYIVDDEPPTIENMEWKPVRIVNDKVYDGTVTFKVRDEKSIIVEASLIFIPKVYSHLPREAFPNETARLFNLTPVDERFDETTEE